MSTATSRDENIPYAPMKMRTKGKINLAKERSIFFINTCFPSRNERRIASMRKFNVCATVNKTKEIKKKLLCVTNANDGESLGRAITVAVDNNTDTQTVINIVEFIFSLFVSDVGR